MFEVENEYIIEENQKLQDVDANSKNVYCIEVDIDTERATKLEVYYNGKKLDCEITSVDYNPTGTLFREF